MKSSPSIDLKDAVEEHGPILAHYVNVARVLGEMFAPMLETVVHDLRDSEHSIIAIFNGQLTGRKVGDPATDFGQQLMAGEFPDVLVGYENESPNGQKLKSSSLAIRDEHGELIGVMGLNFDISYFEQFGNFIDRLTSSCRSDYVPQAEQFRHVTPDGMKTPREDIKEAIDQYVTSQNWNARILSNVEKREIVEHLYRTGYFKNRGAVTIIAQELGLTRPSVYNYKNDYIEQQEKG